MKTARVTRYGGPEVIEIQDVDDPVRSSDEVIVEVIASTINPVDVKTRTPGTAQRIALFPATLGWDVAGIVIDAPGNTNWKAGDRVIAMNPPNAAGNGSWAQRISVPADFVAAAPATLDLASAATIPLAGLTALQALKRLGVNKDEKLLVTGAAGAVGGFAVQIAAARGIPVSGLVSRAAHVDSVLALGASNVSADPSELLGFDTVFDTAGVFGRPELLKVGGRLVTVSDDEIPEAISDRAASAVHNYVRQDPKVLRELVRLFDKGDLRVRVAAHYSLHEIQAAHRRFEGGGLDGKVVIVL